MQIKENLTKVLWLSRHSMTEEQRKDLNRIYGEDTEVVQVPEQVKGYKEVLEYGKGCDVLAVVLPPVILAELTNPKNNQKPVIRAISNRVPTGRMVINTATGDVEVEYKFKFDHWERVIKVTVEVERL